MGVLPDLITFFSAYGSYHNNKINKLIHIVCIPTIVFSLLAIFQHFTFRKDLGGLEINIGLILVSILMTVYLIIDLPSGIISSIIYFSFHITNNSLYYKSLANNTLNSHLTIAVFFQILAWVLQIFGHEVFEGRSPALLDNVLQIFVAPDFVVLEIMFHFGYKHDDHIQIKKTIHNNINSYLKSKDKANKEGKTNK